MDIKLYVGIGMVLSLFLTETLGVTAGGIIVPGYIAMNLEDPLRVIITFGISIITFYVIKILSNFIFIYGKRRLVAALIIAFIISVVADSFRYDMANKFENTIDSSFTVIGHIIPGLIASWIDKQGIVRTLSTIIIVSSITHLLVLSIKVINYN